MATIAVSTTVLPHLTDPHAPVRITIKAGAVFTGGQTAFIHTDGTAHLGDAAVTGIANVSKFDGVVLNAAAIGEPVTLFGIGAKIYITDATLTIGNFYYVAATPGLFNIAAKVATADTYLPVAKCISAHEIMIVRGGI